jgi:hypothetical protein
VVLKKRTRLDYEQPALITANLQENPVHPSSNFNLTGVFAISASIKIRYHTTHVILALLPNSPLNNILPPNESRRFEQVISR